MPPRPPRAGPRNLGRIPPPRVFLPGEGEDAPPVDFAALFGRVAPVEMEIGVGKGRFLLNAAAANRDRDYFGLEIEAEYAAIARLRAERAGLTNVRVERLDGKAFVLRRLAPGAVAALHVYFPDPWPKKRHHKRRLLQPAFVHELALRLQPGGYLHVATDWRDYAGSILAALSAERLLRNTARDYAKRPAYRPVTKFERRGVGLGHEVWDLIFRKR